MGRDLDLNFLPVYFSTPEYTRYSGSNDSKTGGLKKVEEKKERQKEAWTLNLSDQQVAGIRIIQDQINYRLIEIESE